MKEQPEDSKKILTRREIVSLAGLTGAALVLGCGGSGGSSATGTTSTSTTSTTSGSTTSGGTSETCSVTPEGEIGPYFADDSAAGFFRSNILSNIDGTSFQPGVSLTLSVYVYDSENSCKAMSGVQVDIWHCNASGIYSDEAVESTSGLTYLRGYQLTDANGLVTFNTIIPGWYSGRTTHIHLRLRSKYSEASSTSDGTNTTQLFFPQTIIDTIYTTVAPYSSHGTEDTTNTTDHVYTGETHAEMLMTLTGSISAGYAATAAIYLPITSE